MQSFIFGNDITQSFFQLRNSDSKVKTKKKFTLLILSFIFINSYLQVLGVTNIDISTSSQGKVIYDSLDTVSLFVNNQIGTNSYTPGIMLDGSDINYYRTSSQLQGLSRDASFSMVRFFEHRMGKPCSYWNEQTKTGTWDWSKIDSLVRTIFNTGAEPLIVLGFYSWTQYQISSAPSGMSHNPVTGLPYPDQWGAYCAAWVKHFKDIGLPVRYYEIINEPYHYFEWPAEDDKLSYYMELYNAAAVEMKNENNNIKLGCDASTFKKVLDSFIQHGETLGFISFHMYGLSSRSSSTSQALNAAETRWLTESSIMWAPEQAVSRYEQSRGVKLPIIMSEGNFCDDYDPCDDRIFTMSGAVYSMLAMRTFILKNFQHSIYYHFACSGDHFGMVNYNTQVPGYTYYAQKLVGQNLDVGDELLYTTSSSNNLRTLAWINNGKLNMLIINKIDAPKTLRIEGMSGDLTYYLVEKSYGSNSASVQSDTINPRYTIKLEGYSVLLVQSSLSTTPTNPPEPDPPSPPNPPQDEIFNDGFESGNFGSWDSIITTTGETAMVDDLNPHGGNNHAIFTANGGEWEDAYSSISIDEDEVNVRGYFYLENGLPVDEEDRSYFIRLKSNNEWLASIGIRKVNNVNQWVLYARDGDTWPGPRFSQQPNVELGRWYSIELSWKKSVEGSVDVFINGQKMIGLSGIDTSYFGNVDAVEVGITPNVNNLNGLVVYVDDLVISTDYIGP